MSLQPANVMQMTGQAISHLGSRSPTQRAAILNGFGRTLGDGIIGLQALHLAIRLGAIAPRPTLFRLGHLPAMVQSLYDVADFAAIRTLPQDQATPARRFEDAEGFDQIIDIRDFAFDPDFQQTSMIDFFLRRLGVDPHIIPACLRRNSWLPRRVAPPRQQRPNGYVLVCPRASMPLREMPAEIHDCILRHVAAIAPIVTQGRVPSALAGEIAHVPPCATLAELCALVRNASWVISTDTGMVHLADASTCRAWRSFRPIVRSGGSATIRAACRSPFARRCRKGSSSPAGSATMPSPATPGFPTAPTSAGSPG